MSVRWRGLCWLIALLLVVAACSAETSTETSEPFSSTTQSEVTSSTTGGATTTEGQPATGGAMTVALAGEPTTLDLGEASFVPTNMILLYNVVEPLLYADSDGLHPLLADSWDVSDDGLTYTFHLVEATFHDGTELTADDVVFTFNRHRESENFPYGSLDLIETITAVDDRTVEIGLTNPSNAFLRDMARGAGIVLNEDSIDLAGEAPVGTGPFQVTEWQRDQFISIVAFEGYWGEPAQLDEVTWRFIEDQNAAVSALQAGDVDVLARLEAPERARELADDPNFQVMEQASDDFWSVFINNAAPPLDDQRVRQAIVHAIDKQAYVDATFGGFGFPTCGWLSVDNYAYEEYCPYEYDPEAGAALLAEAGYADGLTLSMRGIPVVQPQSELVLAQLAEVGITVENSVQDPPEYFAEVVSTDTPDFEITVLGWPDWNALQSVVCPPTWWIGYCDPEVSDLLSQADLVVDEEQQIDLFRQANRILTDDAVMAPLFNSSYITVYSNEFDGFEGSSYDGRFDIRSANMVGTG